MSQSNNPAANGKVISLNIADQDALELEMTNYLSKCEEKLGFIPNVLKAHAFSNAKLSAFSQYYNVLMLGESELSKLEREMIAVVVSCENHCYYCLTAHGAAVRHLSKDPKLGEQLVMNYRIADLSPKVKSMLDFAVKITHESRKITEDDHNKLRQNGFSDGAIWDIISVAGFFNMSNRMASSTHMQPNDEYHSMART